MKISIEDYNETTNEIEVDYFIDNGELQTAIISRDELWQDVIDNDLNTWHEDKWDYAREEHYTVAHSMDIDGYIDENIGELLLARLYNIEEKDGSIMLNSDQKLTALYNRAGIMQDTAFELGDMVMWCKYHMIALYIIERRLRNLRR